MRDSESPDFEVNEIEYDPVSERYHLVVDTERTAPASIVVVQFIAHVTDRSPLALPPLQSAIDTDYLDSLLSTTRDRQGDAEVTFTYAGYRVTLGTGGSLWAQPADTAEAHADETHVD